MTGVKPCGTEAAYHRHLRRGELACEPCMRAHAQDNNDRLMAPLRRAVLAEAISRRNDSRWRSMMLDVCEAVDGPDPEWYAELDHGGPL